MAEWQAIIPIPPMATPRPQFRTVHTGGAKRTVTYYPTKYSEYMKKVQGYLKAEGLYNKDFFDTINAPFGVLAEVVFYIKVPKTQKAVKNLMRKTAPDIDNLEKAILDSIFKDLKERDSRIVGINALKLNEKDYPRTEIKLIGVEQDGE